MFFYYSTLNWKRAVNEAATFLDGGQIPCLLVENKADLLESEDQDEQSLKEFAQNGEFCGCFRTSAKTGSNIDESMQFLIKTIVKRMEDMQSKGTEVFTTERKSVALDPEKHNEPASRGQRKEACC
jgi:50S ribosomal subunit-associated GTPase HflX